MSERYDLAIIGAGNMAEAIVRGAITADVFAPRHVIAADPSEERRKVFESLGITTTGNNLAAVTEAERVLLAVKPQTLGKLGETLGHIDARSQCVISIMAGLRIAKLAEAMGRSSDSAGRIVRIMPNTPLLVGAGMSAIASGGEATEADVRFADRLVAGAGAVVHVEESKMDAVTAVSGSGPAYLFYLAEAMTHAATDLGLDVEQATLLMNQTIVGAAALLRESPDDAGELRRKVTSPGGTTEAALNHLDAEHVREAIEKAIAAAAARSEELGK